jgi:uncharacterized protein (DUF1778 family)
MRHNGPKEAQLNIRMTKSERAEIDLAADRDRRLVSDWARLALLRLARRSLRRKAA